jgi:hypothetical protein
MDTLINEIAEETGADRDAVRHAIGIVISFLAREGPADKVQPLFDKMPEARAMIEPNGPRGIFGVFNALSGTGLGLSEIQAVARAFLSRVKAKVGAKEVDAVIASIPGLNQFI